jgi:hypothetical protein
MRLSTSHTSASLFLATPSTSSPAVASSPSGLQYPATAQRTTALKISYCEKYTAAQAKQIAVDVLLVQ